MTPVDYVEVARLRTLQRLGNASLNALALRIGDTSDIRPSAEQWAAVLQALEAANKLVQTLADELAAGHVAARTRNRRLRDGRV